jgi:hypothetical protein
MQAPLPSLRAEELRGGGLPPWVSLACEHREAYRAAQGYLRYLSLGLGHIGPATIRLVLHVVSPEDVPNFPPGATVLAARYRYDVARFGRELIYTRPGQASVRVEPATGDASIWTTTFEPDPVAELVSVALLELVSYRGFFGMHAGAVVSGGVGYLLPGTSGSGKTSLCLTLMRAGCRYLTDDFVLLTTDRDPVRCLPLFRTFNVDTSWAEHFAELSFLHDLPPLAHGKRTFDPERCYPGSHIGTARPTVVVFPTIVDDVASEVRPMSKREAFCRLLPQTRLSADARIAEAQVRTLVVLMRDSVAFELRHGRDFVQAPVATVRRLFSSLGDHPMELLAR